MLVELTAQLSTGGVFVMRTWLQGDAPYITSLKFVGYHSALSMHYGQIEGAEHDGAEG